MLSPSFFQAVSESAPLLFDIWLAEIGLKSEGAQVIMGRC